MLPSVPTRLRDSVTWSSLFTSPWSSAKARSERRVGPPMPTPQRNPSDRETPSGSPRTMKPPKPVSSAERFNSLLTIASTRKSALPVPTPSVSLPVGSLTTPRSANATGCWRDSESRLNFAPTSRSPS